MNKQTLMTAIVIDTNDPEKLGRVLLTLPALPDGPQLWARMVSPLAGQDRGLCFLPEIEDEVLVAFTQGDLSNAYVLGGLWGKQKLPPGDIGGDQNDVKQIRTRAGHTIMLNDSEGEEHITIIDKNDNSIVIATSDNHITITSKGDISLSGNTIKLNAKTIEVKADSSLTLDGGGTADLKAGTVNIN